MSDLPDVVSSLDTPLADLVSVLKLKPHARRQSLEDPLFEVLTVLDVILRPCEVELAISRIFGVGAATQRSIKRVVSKEALRLLDGLSDADLRALHEHRSLAFRGRAPCRSALLRHWSP